MPKKSFYDMFDKKAQRIAGTISAILVIGGALFGVGNWINNQVTSAISNQIQEFRQEVKASDNRQDQAITRLELMNLIQNDPTNVAGIEKLARYYFGDLQGNQYMTGMYSNWCREYGGDPSIAVGGK
jgi:cytochrome c-type biogenesis protein CcmH/NrfG